MATFDIVVSFVSKTCLAGVTYLTGHFDINPFSLISILAAFVYRDHWRSKHIFRQQVAIAISLRNEKQMILVNSNRLPPYFNCLDIHNSEFLNKIIHHNWHSLAKHAENVLKNVLGPIINEGLKKYKNSHEFRFQTLRLGSISPRICEIKVYKRDSRKIEFIILDIMLFYAGDIEVYFYFMSLGGGIQNFELHGWLRIVFKYVKQPIHAIGGIEIFFLHKPTFNYEFSGAMDVLRIPGLSGMLRRLVDDQLSSNIVLPNKFVMKISDIADRGYWKCPDPEGLVRIKIIEAIGLQDNGSSIFGPGTPDTYITITFGSQMAVSKIFDSSLNPKWNFRANLMMDQSSFDDNILITVNEREANAILGRVTVDISFAKEKKHLRSWVQLEDTTSGMIYLEVYYYNLTHDLHAVQIQQPYVLVVFISTAFNLQNPLSNKIPNSTVYLEIDTDIKISKSVLSKNPIFEETFLFVINNNKLEKSKLKLKLIDANTNDDLGNATLLLHRVIKTSFAEVIDEHCPLTGAATESSLLFSMRLRIPTKEDT